MKLGLSWGSGLAEPEIVSWASCNASTGGWRGRFGTELWDDPQGLEHALRTMPLTWTYVMSSDGPIYGVTGWEFLSTCETAGLPVLLVLDPMDPGNGQLDGTGYHEAPLAAQISFPEYQVTDLEDYANALLTLIRKSFPSLALAGVQWGNEVEYLPYVQDWEEAYAHYYRGLEALGRVVADLAPDVPVVVGGDNGAETFPIDSQARTALTWYCGTRARDWSSRRAPLALDFHADFQVKTPPIKSSQLQTLLLNVDNWSKSLITEFGLPVYITECGAYRYFDVVGGTAAQAGVAALWGVACRWLVPQWGALSSSKDDTKAFGCFGLPEWPNRPTRESFERLASAHGLGEKPGRRPDRP